jgi:hypothetical protein
MGEIAEMMLEGDLCEACGSALSGEGYGIPRYCSNECARDRGFDGIQSDGAGTYYKKKKVKKAPDTCFSLRVSYNGGAVMKDGRKNIISRDMSFEDAKILGNMIEELVTKFIEELTDGRKTETRES